MRIIHFCGAAALAQQLRQDSYGTESRETQEAPLSIELDFCREETAFLCRESPLVDV
jgi:hypothetical protein